MSQSFSEPPGSAQPVPVDQVAIIMGSRSDWPVMRHASLMLDALGIAHTSRIVSAHRTPERLYDFARSARSKGFRIIIAGAGGAAHLPGMTAALTPLPVFGVPIPGAALGGRDALYSIVQMPGGVPVGTLAIGKPGAINAALLAAAVLALSDEALAARLDAWRAANTAAVDEAPDDLPPSVSDHLSPSVSDHLSPSVSDHLPASVSDHLPEAVPATAPSLAG